MTKNNLYSFDIFDTLVTRRVAVPKGIFTLIQKSLENNKEINNFIKNNFYTIRIGAEEFARFRKFNLLKENEINFDDIYDIIQNNYNLSNEETNFLKELEISTEIKNILPINKNISILKDLIAQNKRVVLISDMYYGEENLRKILTQIDPVFNNIKIYSSSDYKTSKSDKGLYSIVKKSENVEYSNWTHYGDNKYSDIKCAKSLGIKTIYTPQEPLLRYEKKLLKHNSDNYFYQTTIGSAKLSRLNRPKENSDKYDFGASFAGTILYNYVDWILNQSLEKGFKTLYFVARDGYILKIIADIIIEKKNIPLKTKYLYGSRLAWRNLTPENYEMLITSMFKEYSKRLTPEFLSYRLGIDKNEMKNLLNLSSVKSKISRYKIDYYIKLFKQDDKIKQILLKASEERVELLKKYMIQEIDFEENNIAFVDLQGTGKTQDCIAQILNQIKPCKIYGYYLSNYLMKQYDNSIKMSYFSASSYLSDWVELLSRNTEGQTIGYKEENGLILPVTEKCSDKTMIEWGFKQYIDGVISYTYNRIDVEKKNNLLLNTIDLYCDYFDYLTKDLDRNTATVLGKIPFLSIGREDSNILEAAPEIKTLNVIFNFLFGIKPNKVSQFPFISKARSSKISKLLQNLIQDCPTLQKFLLNVYINKKLHIAFIRIFGIKISFNNII